MKHLLLVLSVFFAGSLTAQRLESTNVDIKFPANNAAMDGANLLLRQQPVVSTLMDMLLRKQQA